MNLLDELRPRYRVHLRLLAYETTGLPYIEPDPEENLEGLIRELGGFMGYEGDWRDWSDARQFLVAAAVIDGLNDFDFREIDTSTEEVCDG